VSIVIIVIMDDQIGPNLLDSLFGPRKAALQYFGWSGNAQYIQQALAQPVVVIGCRNTTQVDEVIKANIDIDLIIADNRGVGNTLGIDYLKDLSTVLSQVRRPIPFSIMCSGDRRADYEHVVQGVKNFVEWYHQDKRGIGLLQEGLIKCLNSGSFKPEFFPKALPIEFLSFLKHRIAHLFLSLDLDLQGVEETWEEGREAEAVKYLKEVLAGKDREHYRRKIADLQFMVAKVDQTIQNTATHPDGSFVGPSLTITDLPDGQSVIELSQRDQQQDVPEMTQAREVLCKLSGLTEDGNSADPASPIFQFLCRLDKKVKKVAGGEDIAETDVQEVLCLQGATGEQGECAPWHVPGARPEQIRTFHDWFCALDEALGRLRETLAED